MSEFGPFRLDTVNQCLWRGTGGDEERILLTPKAFALLRYLVEHPGRLVTHDELLNAVWPKTYVQSEVLKSQIAEIRALLGDDARKPLFIETLARRGYRFLARVTEGASAKRAAVSGSAKVLVGRRGPLAALHQCLERMSNGERQVVFITGEPGIGKTAVADAFIDLAMTEISEIRTARGQCIEGYGSKEAYYPMLEALSVLCRGDGGDAIIQILAAQAPTWLVQFPGLLTPDRSELLRREVLGATRERMLREIGEALEAIALRSPLVLLFEDLQWVDYSTIDLISVMARRRTVAKLMVVATYRDDDVALSEHPLGALKQDLRARYLCQEIALGPLNEAQVVDYLVAEQPGSSFPDGLAALVYRHSEGNPLFMVAALDHLMGRGLIARQTGGGWQLRRPLNEIELAVPENLREMIEAQVERLSPEEQQVLEVASLTQDRAFSVIARAAAAMDADPGHLEKVCERLSRRTHILRPGILEELPDGTVSPFYEFVHALYREVLYGRIAPSRRAQLHRQAAEWAEATFAEHVSEAAPFLAHHFEHGGDYTRATAYLRAAAQTAGRRYAPREATAHLQHALELSSGLPDPARAKHELAVLEELAAMYVVSFDTRAVETYDTFAERAAASGLIDLEVKALIDMAYPLSWIDADRSLAVVDRALRLSTQQRDPLQQARTRASCLVRRIWVGGWNARDAEDCRHAVEDIRRSGDRHLLAAHLIDSNFIRWGSSEYRAAHQDVVESLAVLVGQNVDNPYLSFAHWLSQFTLPWSLLFLGEWGEALRILAAEIALADKNGDRYRAQTLQLYRAWLHLHAMDFPGVLELCHSILPSLNEPARRPWRRFCLALMGSAEAARGRYAPAVDHLMAARNEMDEQKVIHDWYWRMILEQALTDVALAKGDLTQAESAVERFLAVTLTTAERTWQALAWEAGARVAMARVDDHRARTCIDNARLAMEGFEVPLAAWRVHATAGELERRWGNERAAKRHYSLGRETVLALAHSLVAHERLREAFLEAPSVRAIIESSRPTGPDPR